MVCVRTCDENRISRKEGRMKAFLPHAIAIGAAAVALALGLGTGAFGKGTSSASGRTVHVIEHATTDAVTDTGAQGDSAGDVLTFANELFDRSDAKHSGH